MGPTTSTSTVRRAPAETPYATRQKFGFKGRLENAQHGRRADGWKYAYSTGPNSTVLGDLTTARNRSRYEVENNPFALRVIKVKSAAVIGSGIHPHFPKDSIIPSLWRDFVEQIDADGNLSFVEMQRAVYEAKLTDGECLGILRPRDEKDTERKGLAVPLQVQLLEADHLPVSLNDPGRNLRAGIQFSPIGEREGYRILKQHPSDQKFGDIFSKDKYWFIPANDMMHIFSPPRIGAIRGMPILSNVILKLHDLDRYEDAELVRKKVSALDVVYIYKPTVDADPAKDLYGTNNDRATDNPTANITEREPGGERVIPPGWDIKHAPTTDVGSNYDPFIRSQFRAVSAGTGVPYHLLTHDYAGHNDRTLRISRLDWSREVVAEQEMLVKKFCRPILRAFLEACIASGKWKVPAGKTLADYINIRWIPDPQAHVHPEQEVNVKIKEIRSGLSTLSKQLESEGLVLEDVLTERAAELEIADRLGLILDTDPRVEAGLLTKKNNSENP